MEGEAYFVFGSNSTEVGKLLPILQVVAWLPVPLVASRELPALGGRHLNADQPSITTVLPGPDAVDSFTRQENQFSFFVVITWVVSYISPDAPF